jgi:hypothetical protein
MDFENISCWLYSVVPMQALKPSTLYSWFVHFFQWYVSLELASYLVEITFTLHVCMKMIKALGILTTWAKKPT